MGTPTLAAAQCSTSGRMPTVFLPHGGGPMPVLGDRSQASLTAYLRGVAKSLPKPKAILAVTAHWEAERVTVSTCPTPPMLYDYYGFPPEAYQLKYDAPGSPEVASRVLELLRARGIPAAADDTRGYDHGTFIPLMLAYPSAEVPVVQMSLQRSLDPKLHTAVGEALAPLRDEGVLIVGTGMSFHNMRVFMSMGFGASPASTKPYKPSEDFDAWLQQATCDLTGKARNEQLAKWAQAPGGRESHPREEHLIPLMVAAGAAGVDAGRVPYTDYLMGAKTSGFVFGA